MALVASEFVNWSALWKICVAAMVGGAGVATAFGLLLLGLKQFNTSKSSGTRTAGVVLSGLCAVFVAAAVVLGIYAMTQKPSAKKPATHKSAETRSPRASGATAV